MKKRGGHGHGDDAAGTNGWVHDLREKPATTSTSTSKQTAAAAKRCTGDLHPILSHFIASILLHGQCLSLFFQDRESWLGQALVSAGIEGICVLSLASLLLSHSQWWLRALAVLWGVCAVGALLYTFIYMKRMGSTELPEMWVVVAGFKGALSYIDDEVSADFADIVWSVVGAVGTAVPAARLVYLTTTGRRRQMKPRHVLLFFILMVLLMCAGAWMPIFHTYASLTGSLFLSPPGSSPALTAALLVRAVPADIPRAADGTTPAPNVVLLVHESLSGEFPLTRAAQARRMPFLHRMKESRDEYFLFEHARTVSGDTADAMSAIHTGCLPLDHREGKAFALNTTLATQFKRRGYETVSFSSRELDMDETKWFMVQNQLSLNFDQVLDFKMTGERQSDILMGRQFEKWLTQRREERERTGKEHRPFYAQFYYFDSHYPFFSDKTVTNATSRIDGMLRTVDQSIENVFGYLRDAGELPRTIVVGTGDHGENYDAQGMSRLNWWTNQIMHPPVYMFFPRPILEQHAALFETLRHNTRQLVSTLDIQPTVLRLLDGFAADRAYPETDSHCVRGHDLLARRISDARVAWSFPGVTTDFATAKKGHLALHYGTASSLYQRLAMPKVNGLSVIEYGVAVGAAERSATHAPLTIAQWKAVLQQLKGTRDHAVLLKKGRFIAELEANLEKAQDDVTE